MAPGRGLNTPRNRTGASGSKITPRAKTCVPGADRAVNRNVTGFSDSGNRESTSCVLYDFLGLCDSWTAHIFLGSAFDVFTTTKVDGYLRTAGHQPSPVCHIKPLSILLQYWPRLVG